MCVCSSVSPITINADPMVTLCFGRRLLVLIRKYQVKLVLWVFHWLKCSLLQGFTKEYEYSLNPL